MDWKKYRDYFAHNKIDEEYFLLGIDLGSSSSAIAYFDTIRKNGEVVDISGGYGKASAPTMMQHVAETDELIFGEYAILNANGTDALMTDFVARLGSGDNTDMAAAYLTELISNCRSINPKAQIAGIVAAAPDFIGASAKNAIVDVFKKAGYEKALIALVDEREAYLSHFLYNQPSPFVGRVILLDFGARGMRGGVYDIDGANAACVYSALDENLSTSALDAAICNLFTDYYCANRKTSLDKLNLNEMAQLRTFAYQHKDMALRTQDLGKPARLYYNFPYPPFSQNLLVDDVAAIVRPMEALMTDFVKQFCDKAPTFNGDTTLICAGGGFEMPWAKSCINAVFGGDVMFYKNSKAILAEGASIMAAAKMKVTAFSPLTITDTHKMPCDVGINVSDGRETKFFPIIEKGSWLWQKPASAYVILKDDSREIEILSRIGGEEKQIGRMSLDGLPTRPPGTTKLAISIKPDSISKYHVTIRDLGFGELFPSTGLEVQMRIEN